MVWKVVLSEFMDKQVITKPPVEGFPTKKKAETWALMTYGSTAIDAKVCGKDVGCHIVEE